MILLALWNVKKFASEVHLKSLKISKKRENVTFYDMNIQQIRDFVKFYRAFLNSSDK